MKLSVTASWHHLPWDPISNLIVSKNCFDLLENPDRKEREKYSPEWITKRSWVESRHYVEPWQTSTDLWALALQNLLARNEKVRNKITEESIIIFTTLTAEKSFPSWGASISKICWLPEWLDCFDVKQACIGALKAVQLVADSILLWRSKNGIVIAAESMSSTFWAHDPSLWILFGDGSWALFIEPSEVWLSIDTKSFNFKTHHSLSNLASMWTWLYPDSQPFILEWRPIYKEWISKAVERLKHYMNSNAIGSEEIWSIYMHQANIRMIQAISKESWIPQEKFISNIKHVGNVWSASIPILLSDLEERWMINLEASNSWKHDIYLAFWSWFTIWWFGS